MSENVQGTKLTQVRYVPNPHSPNSGEHQPRMELLAQLITMADLGCGKEITAQWIQKETSKRLVRVRGTNTANVYEVSLGTLDGASEVRMAYRIFIPDCLYDPEEVIIKLRMVARHLQSVLTGSLLAEVVEAVELEAASIRKAEELFKQEGTQFVEKMLETGGSSFGREKFPHPIVTHVGQSISARRRYLQELWSQFGLESCVDRAGWVEFVSLFNQQANELMRNPVTSTQKEVRSALVNYVNAGLLQHLQIAGKNYYRPTLPSTFSPRLSGEEVIWFAVLFPGCLGPLIDTEDWALVAYQQITAEIAVAELTMSLEQLLGFFTVLEKRELLVVSPEGGFTIHTTEVVLHATEHPIDGALVGVNGIASKENIFTYLAPRVHAAGEYLQRGQRLVYIDQVMRQIAAQRQEFALRDKELADRYAQLGREKKNLSRG